MVGGQEQVKFHLSSKTSPRIPFVSKQTHSLVGALTRILRAECC